jgi:DNA modification methylase
MGARVFYDDGQITLFCGRCEDVLPALAGTEAHAIVTSPPYAEQRAGYYEGIPEAEYPTWTAGWLAGGRDALRADGSALVNIREHVRDGEISDYVHRTRLAVRAAGWYEADELIWIKPDAPPVGHPGRPRRSWERVLWFAKDRQPWCDPQANGRPSKRVGMDGARPAWVKGAGAGKDGIARCQDYVTIPVDASYDRKAFDHPAPFPLPLAAWLIRLVVPPGGIVIDPFAGIGTTLRAAKDAGRRAIGVELSESYCRMAVERLRQSVLPLGAA